MSLFGVRLNQGPELERRLAFLELALTDLRSLWPMVTRAAIGWIGKQFDEEGAFFGEPWTALSPDYAEWKDQNYPGSTILSREGFLRSAATSPTREVTPVSLTLTIEPYDNNGTTVDPAWFQDGTSRMPARPLLPADGDPLPAEAEVELQAAADLYVRDMLARSGLLG